MKKLLKRWAEAGCERLSYKLVWFNREQVVPEHIPDVQLYTGPEDQSRFYRPWHSSEYDAVFNQAVVQNTMMSPRKLYYLHKLFRQALQMPGDIFEAGAGSGGSGRLMLEALRGAGLKKRMWLLDTFEGYQKVERERDGSHMQINGCRCKSKEEVEHLLQNDSVEVHLIKGLIPATLNEVKTDQIAFAHIDVNLFEPTLAATEFCLQRMPKGGIILFDDYGWPATHGARMAIEEACRRHGQNIISLIEQAFLIKQ